MIDFIKHIAAKAKGEYKLFGYKKKFIRSSINSLLNSTWEDKIKEFTVIEQGCDLKGEIEYIGIGLFIGKNTLIYNCETIGNFCSISSDVKIGLVAHPKTMLSTSPLIYSKGRGLISETIFNGAIGKRVIIKHDVLISSNAMILNGLTIETGAIIGAGAVVTRDVPAYAIVGGVPAKILGYRFDPLTISQLLQSEWWNLAPEEIIRLPYLKNGNLIKNDKA